MVILKFSGSLGGSITKTLKSPKKVIERMTLKNMKMPLGHYFPKNVVN
jgi:hypothetical protein